MIEVVFTLLNSLYYTQAENNLLSVNREKRSDSTSIFKDQIFKRIEVLQCTVTMSTIKSTSKLKYEHKYIFLFEFLNQRLSIFNFQMNSNLNRIFN